jgi:hypothetical protein
MTKRTIYLHVGHGKTGSSFLQSCFAMSEETLQAANIHYPDLTNSFAAARAGRITAGNIHSGKMPLGDAIEKLDRGLPEEQAILFSHEELFEYMNGPAAKPILERVAAKQYDLRVLCFVRNPLDHAVSLYQQTVKRSGNFKTFAEFLDNYRVPQEVLRFVRTMSAAGAKTTIYNYSKHKEKLTNILETWLGLSCDALKKPDKLVVNRSVTNGELAFQIEFNKFLGSRAASFISDPLCNNLPDIKSENPAITHKDLEAFLLQMAEITKQTNDVLPLSESYTVPDLEDAIAKFPDPKDPMLFSFTQDQLRVIADRISRTLINLDQ